MNNIISLGVILAVLLVYFGIGKRGIWQAARTPDSVKLWASLPGIAKMPWDGPATYIPPSSQGPQLPPNTPWIPGAPWSIEPDRVNA